MLNVIHYVTAAGVDVFDTWVNGLRDRKAAAKVLVRVNRLALGNFGDCEPVGEGVLELRIDWGPGYRVYIARLGSTVVLLICGGDKSTQQKDIKDAKVYLSDYKARTAKEASAKGGSGRSSTK